MRQISREGINLIKKYEGFRSKPYLCPAGVPTTGYGTTVYPNGKKVKMTDPAITEAEASFLLGTSVDKQYGKAVNDLVVPEIGQGMFDALCSFVYNLGVGSFKSSTLLKKINALDFGGAALEFRKWNKAGGKVLAGLTARRADEEAMFRKDLK